MFLASQSSPQAQTVSPAASRERADVTYRLDGIDAPAPDQICIDDHADTWCVRVDARDQLAG